MYASWARSRLLRASLRRQADIWRKWSGLNPSLAWIQKYKTLIHVLIPRISSQLKTILGQDSTFFRGILGKMQSKDLKNCPRNSSEAKSSEDSFWGPRTASFPEIPRKRWSLIIIPWLCWFTTRTGVFRKRGILGKMHHTSENVASWEYCFPRCHVFRSVMYLGKQYSQDATFSKVWCILENSTPKMPRFWIYPE